MALLLGIDVSTTATKALLVDPAGTVVATAASGYELATPRPLWAEQDPRLWWEGTEAAVGEVLEVAGCAPSEVAAIGLTGQMHGLVALDEAKEVVRPAILWNDQRAAEECEEIRCRVGGRKRLVEITGNDAFAGFSAPKLLWMRHHEPEIYRRVRHVLLPKDYVRYRLTGDLATDKAGAGGTLFLDLESRDWSGPLLDALEVPREWLPVAHEGTEITGTVSAEASARTGLAAGTPVVGGGGDQAAQAVGVGAIETGVVALTLGTSGVVFAASDRPLVEPRGRLHSFPHALPGTWHVMGVMLSAGGSLRWYRDVVAPGVAFDDLVSADGAIEPGAEGLFFLPYLSGERTPHADPWVRGGFVGLSLRHGRGHLTRAVLEGVAFGLRDNLALMSSVGLGGAEQIRISGGGTRNVHWRQVLADVLATDLVRVQTTEGAALGAALLAGVGRGVWSTIQEACGAAVRLGEVTRPDPGARDRYEPIYERFGRHYPAIRPLFDQTTREHGGAR